MRLILSVIALLAAAPGCRGDGSQQVAEAVESFIDFGMSNEERPAETSGRDVKARPHLPERSRQVKQGRKGAPVLWIDVDVPHHLDRQQVIEALDAELDRLLEETAYPTIKLRALPGGLLHHGKTMGEALATRSQNGEVEREVWSRVRDDQPPLTSEQYYALVDLELELASAGSKSKGSVLQKVRERQGRKLLDSAIQAARQRWSGAKRAAPVSSE